MVDISFVTNSRSFPSFLPRNNHKTESGTFTYYVCSYTFPKYYLSIINIVINICVLKFYLNYTFTHEV